jgi:hypothetical protein
MGSDRLRTRTDRQRSVRAVQWVRRAAALSVAAVALGGFAALSVLTGTAVAASAPAPADAGANFMFRTLDNGHDRTFNQLLGINNEGVIAGYFGSGQKGHPNRGYTVSSPYGQGSYVNENFPGAAQTQVTGIDNSGYTVGFWVDGAGANNGFYELNGHQPQTVDFPANDNAKPSVDQLLGINDSGIAAGFYTDAKGVNHGFTYNIAAHRFKVVNVPGDTNVTAAAINGERDVAGFATNSAGVTEGYLERSDGRLFRLDVPGASATQAFGVNDGDEVVGDYTVGTGNSAMTYGFVWAPGFGFETVNDPNGVGSTTINGINDRGTLVGFYTDSAGNTDGFVAKANG